MKSVLRLVVCLAICYGIAAVGGWSTIPNIPTWYAGLAKPAWTPPNWVFPVVWNTLYGLIAVSLWLLWDRTPESDRRSRALKLFVAQLVLNALWSPVFFALHYVWAGLLIILAMVVLVVLTIRESWPIHRGAALLLVPYLMWISYASTLNAGIGIMNPR
jgi:tryptophan-rich sensory protein